MESFAKGSRSDPVRWVDDLACRRHTRVSIQHSQKPMIKAREPAADWGRKRLDERGELGGISGTVRPAQYSGDPSVWNGTQITGLK